MINAHGDLEGILAEASRPESKINGSVRSKLAAAIDYLAVAPTVVGVARDLELGVDWDDLELPPEPARPERFAELAELLALGTSADRVRAALAGDA